MNHDMRIDRYARFGGFELDLETGDIRRNGFEFRLQDKPFRILKALLSRPGEIVTRQEICRAVWPEDVHVDFETGLNTAMRRLRRALEESAAEPRLIETVERTGYRFIAPVEFFTERPTQLPLPDVEPQPIIPRNMTESRFVKAYMQVPRVKKEVNRMLAIAVLVAALVGFALAVLSAYLAGEHGVPLWRP